MSNNFKFKFDFTPGKWEIDHMGNIVTYSDDYKDHEEEPWYEGEVNLIAYDEGILGSGNKEQKANARLISKSPEMLETLIEYCEIYSRMNGDIPNYLGNYNLFCKARKLIEEATGKTWEEINEFNNYK